MKILLYFSSSNVISFRSVSLSFPFFWIPMPLNTEFINSSILKIVFFSVFQNVLVKRSETLQPLVGRRLFGHAVPIGWAVAHGHFPLRCHWMVWNFVNIWAGTIMFSFFLYQGISKRGRGHAGGENHVERLRTLQHESGAGRGRPQSPTKERRC